MTLGELFMGIMLGLLTAIGGLTLITHSGELSAYQLELARFVNNEPVIREALIKTAGMAQRTRIYSTAAGASSGSQALISTSGPVVRMDYSGGANAANSASWSAMIEFRSADQRLVYRNISNSNEWVIAARVTAATFSIVNGVLVLDATMDGRPFSIYASIN